MPPHLPSSFPLTLGLALGLVPTFMRGWSTPLKMKDLAVAFTPAGMRPQATPLSMKGFPVAFTLTTTLTLTLALTLSLGLGLGAPPAVAAEAEQVLNFGIYAYRPPEIMMRRFAPLASHLGERLPGTRVVLKAMSQEELDQAVRSHQVDLVLTNPRHYLQLRTHSHLTGAIATLVKRAFDGSPTRSLGGVIFTHAGRDDLVGLADLAGQRVAIPGPYHTGGYMAQLYEIVQAGLPPPAQAQFLDVGSHDAVV